MSVAARSIAGIDLAENVATVARLAPDQSFRFVR